MGFLKKLFGREKPKTMYDKLMEISNPLIINRYRQLAMQRNCPPSSKTSDAEILEVYREVMQKFKSASIQKGDEIPANTVNYIVFYFLNIYENKGKEFYRDHLSYEIMKYQVSGLRNTYQNQEIKLF